MKAFRPSAELMKKVYWTNRFSDRIMLLHERVHRELLLESENWGSDKHLYLRKLSDRIAFKIHILSRYSALLTTAALK